jgi:hypothetical protein
MSVGHFEVLGHVFPSGARRQEPATVSATVQR